MKKIRFGRYVHKDSLLHAMNPLVKLLTLVIFISLSAAAYTAPRLLIVTAVFCTMLVLAKVSLKEFYPSVRSFRFLLILTFVIQAFFTLDGSVMLPTAVSLRESLLAVLRFAYIIAFSAIFTLTTTPADIARSLYFFVRPFKRFKVNTSNAAVSLLVAVRFIPLLFEEAEKIITAQKLRNVWDDSGGWLKKFSFFIKAESFVIPLFVRVVHYAEQISVTLCYRRNIDSVMAIPRAKMNELFFLGVALVIAVAAYAL